MPEITAEDRSFLHYNPNTDDIVEWVQHYASAAITADRAMRAQAAPAAAAGPVDELAELSLLNRLIDLGSRAAGAHAASNSDDGHKGTAAYMQWQELRSQMGDLIRAAYAAPATQPAPVAQGDAEQRQMDAKHAAIYRWIIQHIDKAASIIDAWRKDGEADKDELHDALAARAAKEGAQHG